MNTFFNQTRVTTDKAVRKAFNNHKGEISVSDTGCFCRREQYLIALDADGNRISDTVQHYHSATSQYASAGADITSEQRSINSLPKNWATIVAHQRMDYCPHLDDYDKVVARKMSDGSVQIYAL